MATLKSNVSAFAGVLLSGPARMGPFKSSAGNFYVIAPIIAGSLRQYQFRKASSVTGSWSTVGTTIEIGDASATDTGGPAIQNGDLLHIVVVSDSFAGAAVIRYYTFDMSTDTTSGGTSIDSHAQLQTQSADISITNGTTRYLVIFANGRRDKVMGVDYQRVDAWYKTLSGGTWSAAFAADAAGEFDYEQPLCAGGSDNAHCFWKKSGSDIEARSFDPAAETFSTLRTQSHAGTVALCEAISFDDGGTWRGVLALSDSSTFDMETYNFTEPSGDISALSSNQTAIAGASAGNHSDGKAEGSLILTSSDDKEYLAKALSAADGGPKYVSRDRGSSGTWSSEIVIEAGEKNNEMSFGQITRDGSTYLDIIMVDRVAASDVDYWEVVEVPFPAVEGRPEALLLVGVGH